MKEDTTSRDEAGAAAHAQILGQHEHIGSGVGDQDYDPALDKAAGADPWKHSPTREEAGHVIRATCTCDRYQGRWRSRMSRVLEKQLNRDDRAHIDQVRRNGA